MISIMDELRRKFGNVEELKVAVVSNQGGGRGDSRPVQVGLRGSDLELLKLMLRIWRKGSDRFQVLLMLIFLHRKRTGDHR